MNRKNLTTGRWLRVAGWVVCLLIPTGPARADDTSIVQSRPHSVALTGGVQIEISTADGQAALTSLRAPTGPEWAGTFAEKASLWRLAMKGPATATAEFASGELPLAEVDAKEGRIGLTWKATVGNGEARISLDLAGAKADPLTRWSLRADLPAGWHVAKAEWPILPNVQPQPGLKMAAPFGWGLEYEVKPGMGYAGTYPSLIASMPFVAFYRDGKGLYIGAHDRHGHHKHLGVQAREDGTVVTFTHWPAEADTIEGRYAPDFHVAVGVFDGDDWNASQIYRAFSQETPWGDPDRLRLSKPNRGVPEWLENIELWLMPAAQPLENVDACRKASAFFGVPIALHWYHWHEIPFDTLYPDYFPAKPHFREGVKALQQAGFRVMPYINGRLCDPNSRAWTQRDGAKVAARQESGEPYTEVYGSKVPLHVMCPGTRQWRDEIAGLVDRLINEEGVDGVYIDQISAAHAVRCFSAEHGHSPGGGTMWVEGYRRLLDEIRAKLPQDRVLTSEENAECWNDQFDALLMVNTPSVAGRRIIPLMPAVYGGRLITFGYQYLSGEDLTRSLPFREKMARAFLWGAQLGWIRIETIMAESARNEAEFLRNLARARQGGHAFLLTGRFLGELAVSGDNPRLTGEGTARGGTYAIDVPAVLATGWLAKDGTVGLAVVNLSDEPHTVAIAVPWQRLRELDGRAASRLGPGETATGEAPPSMSITLPPRDAQVVRVRSARPPA